MLDKPFQRIRRFLGLPLDVQVVFLEAVTYLVITRVGLSIVSYDSVRRTLTAGRTLFDGSLTPGCSRDRIQWAVEVAASILPGSYQCLEQALVAEQLLKRRNYDSTIQFGVDVSDHDFAAHAWVESGGEVVVGDGTRSEFSRLE